MRPVSFQRKYLKTPAGSCLAVFGETKVICTCTIEEGTPPFVQAGGWLTAEYAMLPGSVSAGRKRRDGAEKDGRSVEIQRLIGRSLRAAVDLAALPEVTLTVDCDVLQADGGTRTASISGGWVALVDALAVLAGGPETGRSGKPAGPAAGGGAAYSAGEDSAGPILRATASNGGPLSSAEPASAGRPPADLNRTDPRDRIPAGWLAGRVAAVSVGIVGGTIVCDLDYEADRNAEVDMNVVTLDESYVEIQGTGEKGVFDKDGLSALLTAADEGLAAIAAAQDAALAD